MIFELHFRRSIRKLLIVFALSCFYILSISWSDIKQSTSSKTDSDEYKLVWADEFNIDGQPNPDNWDYENGFVRNEEEQWYQPDNAYCQNGYLVIEAKREQKSNPLCILNSDDWRRNRPVADYTSSSLRTKGLHSWLFGRFEIRAKIDTRPGLWPAFWTLGVNRNWPYCGEIDIMEYYTGKLLANIAWGAEQKSQPIWNSFTLPVKSLKEKDNGWSDKFHVWRMDWDENSIKLYIDDTLLNSADLANTFNKDAEGANPFHQPHYIIINLAIGGTAGGDPSQTQFPAFYEIDYVRVYQKKN